jgi:hypothetical protein
MAPNDDRDRPEDNPFIAFRRFADSQVSSLLNTVFTLPATIANFNNAHVAREHCLFGSGDKVQCGKLAEIEKRITQLRSEGRELYRAGDLDQVLKKAEDLMHLDRQADELRRAIVEAGKGTADAERLRPSRQFEGLQKEIMKELGWNKTDVWGAEPATAEAKREWDPWNEGTDHDQVKQRERTRELIERVGNEKGQQWGWSWDWGFPRPFDQNDNTVENTGCRRRHHRWHPRRLEQQLEAEDQRNDQARHDTMATVNKSIQEELQALRSEYAQLAEAAGRDWATCQQVYDEFGNAIAERATRILASPSYSPAALEDNAQLSSAGIHWRDAFEDLIRAEYNAPLIPNDHLGAYEDTSYDRWARRFHDPSYARAEFAQWIAAANRGPVVPHSRQIHAPAESEADEVSYEYAHDHEDSHDDPPTPKAAQGKWSDAMPNTELDAYERLLGRPGASAKTEGAPRASVLSTLTTTERTVAPDGTITTKVVLKKRFADGREESSETVHTARGQNEVKQHEDAWKAMQDAQATPKEDKSSEKKKSSSWFWSS